MINKLQNTVGERIAQLLPNAGDKSIKEEINFLIEIYGKLENMKPIKIDIDDYFKKPKYEGTEPAESTYTNSDWVEYLKEWKAGDGTLLR